MITTRSSRLFARAQAILPGGVDSPVRAFKSVGATPLFVARASGSHLTDVDGNTFIDFAGGVGSLNVGHNHPEVVAAAHEQLDRFVHTDFTVVAYEPYAALAERLAERVPIAGPLKAAFFNAGTEAVENSVKFARAYTKRPAVIVFEGAFHGRTMLSMTVPAPESVAASPPKTRATKRARRSSTTASSKRSRLRKW